MLTSARATYGPDAAILNRHSKLNQDRQTFAASVYVTARQVEWDHNRSKGYSVNRTSRKILVRLAAMTTASSGLFSSGPLK